MTDTQSIGEKIKYFREKANISQLDLEVRIDAASGSLSRIESGKVNPSRETLIRICSALKLNKVQTEYLEGLSYRPPTEEEIQDAIETTKEYFNNPATVALLRDERSFIHNISEGWHRFFKIDREEARKIIGRATPIEIFRPGGYLRKLKSKKHYPKFAELSVVRMLEEIKDLQKEPWFKEMLDELMSIDIYRDIYERVKDNPPKDYFTGRSRIVHWSIEGKEIPTIYSRDVIITCPRFDVVDFLPIEIDTEGLIKLEI